MWRYISIKYQWQQREKRGHEIIEIAITVENAVAHQNISAVKIIVAQAAALSASAIISTGMR